MDRAYTETQNRRHSLVAFVALSISRCLISNKNHVLSVLHHGNITANNNIGASDGYWPECENLE
jgi:hypothetical protein